MLFHGSKFTDSRAKRTTLVVLALSIAVGLYFAVQWGIDRVEDAREEAALNEQIDKIIYLSDLDEIEDFQKKADAARDLVNDNSTHNIDKNFYKLWGNHEAFAREVLAHLQGKRETRPHMECSTRANLLAQILRRDGGYETRNVVLYNPEDELKTHRVIGVRNPDTGRWESQDPDYDVYWKNKATGQRASLPQVVGNVAAYIPCGEEGCGWDHVTREQIRVDGLKDYLHIISVHDKKTDRRFALYGPEVDPNKVYTNYEGKTGTFCEIEAENCEDGFFPAATYKEY